jgi:hypothetical protein
LTVPVEVDFKLSDYWAIAATVHYRHENYAKSFKPWNDYHEVFLMAGPRLSMAGRGLSGPFLSAQLGGGYAASPAPYQAVSLVVQPEVGYAFGCSAGGFCASLGLGVLINMPLIEEPRIRYSTIGYLVHRFVPVVDVRLGFGL